MSAIMQHVTLLFLFTSTAWANVPGMDLLGSGEVRYLGLIKVYHAKLYSDARQRTDILASDVSRCLSLTYEVPLTVDDFIRGAEAILSRQHAAEEIESVRREINLLHQAYQNVAQGDTYLLCYNARDRRTTLSLNNRELTAITSTDFAKLYFGIWLGEKSPIDDRLRRDLLAGTATRQGR